MWYGFIPSNSRLFPDTEVWHHFITSNAGLLLGTEVWHGLLTSSAWLLPEMVALLSAGVLSPMTPFRSYRLISISLPNRSIKMNTGWFSSTWSDKKFWTRHRCGI